MNLNYFMPTRVIMGSDCIVNQCEIFKTLGTKALIVTGARSAKQNGSQRDVITALESVGINYLVFDKVMSNPTIACAYEGASIAKENGIDFIIAIGGGSPMDAGKAISLLASQDISEENLFSGNYENKILPMAFVPTTAGTGSEVTQYSILTNDKTQTKTSISSALLFPNVSFLDAKYTEKLSSTTTINTAVDALSHAVEGMLSVKSSEITDAIAIQSIEHIIECFPGLVAKALTQEEREKLLYASMLAGIVIAHTGTTAVHAMGYSLTYFENIDHGRANGLLLGEFLAFVAKEKTELVAKILKAMKLSKVEEFKLILDKLLGDKEVITLVKIKQFAEIAIKTKNIANCPVIPTYEDLVYIFRASFGQYN